MSGTKQVFHHSVNRGRLRYVIQVFSDNLSEKHIPYPSPLRSMFNDVVGTHYEALVADEDRENVLRLAAEQVKEAAAELEKINSSIL